MRDRMPLMMSILMLALLCLFLGFGIDSAREQGIRLSGVEADATEVGIPRFCIIE